MEDIITLVNNGAIEQIETSANVNQYLNNSFRELVENRYGREIILSHLSGVDRRNVDFLVKELTDFVNT